jgi:hypothetical protein
MDLKILLSALVVSWPSFLGQGIVFSTEFFILTITTEKLAAGQLLQYLTKYHLGRRPLPLSFSHSQTILPPSALENFPHFHLAL